MKKPDSTTFHLGKKQYTFKFDDRSTQALAQHFGTITSLIKALSRKNTISYFILCWAGLLHEYPDLTLVETGDLLFSPVSKRENQKISVALVAALEAYGIPTNTPVNVLLQDKGRD